MKYLIAAAVIMASPAAIAQGVANIPSPNAEFWATVPSANGANFVHKKSGGVCTSAFRDLKLVGIRDYSPDGTNSGCQYEKRDENGLTRMTIFFYTYPGASVSPEFAGAKNAIEQIGQYTRVTTAENRGETAKCFNAMMAQLGPQLLSNMGMTEETAPAGAVKVGVAMFEMGFEANGGQPARQEYSLLTVYETNGWIMKTRVNGPKTEAGSQPVCQYGALASIAEAKAIGGK